MLAMKSSRVSVVEADEAENFEPWGPKYMCCCGSVHVKQGSLIIAILTIVLILYCLFVILLNLGIQSGWSWIQIIWLLVDLLIVALSIYGTVVENHKFLVPYLIYSLHSILLLIIGVSIALYCLFWPADALQWFPMEMLFEEQGWAQGYYDAQRALKTAAIFIAISCLLTLIIVIWWTWVAWKCYRFVRKVHRLKFYLDELERKRYMPLRCDS